MTREEKLAAIMRRSTKYELVATKGNVRVLIGYTQRTRPGLLQMCRRNGEAVVALCGGDSITFGKKASDGVRIGEWAIAFSGRTQRDAIIEGEHDFVVRLAADVSRHVAGVGNTAVAGQKEALNICLQN